MDNKYAQVVLQQTTMRLQEKAMDEMERLGRDWYAEARRHPGGKRLYMSAILRCFLEVMMPIVEQMDTVQNEEDFIEQLKAHLIDPIS